MEAYLASLDLSPRSRDTYRKAVGRFLDWVEQTGRPITALRREDVLAYKDELLKSCTPATAAAYLTAVRSLFSFLHASTGYPDICRDVKNPKAARGHTKDALSASEARGLLEAMPRGTEAQLRNYAVVCLLLHTGLRTAEAAGANLEDVRRIAGAPVLYVKGKGHDAKDDFVKLTKAPLEALSAYLRAREAREGILDGAAPLFASDSPRNRGERLSVRSLSRICKDALRRAGHDSPRLTAHSLRHTAVTCALEAGATIREAQQMARHASPLTTERYAHDLRRLEDAAEDKLEALLTG